MLHEKMKKLMSGKKGMSDNEKNAKMDVVQHLRDMASDAMKGRMDSHKVSVASDSSEGLKHGLEKAKEIVSSSEQAKLVHDAENPEHDALSAHEEHRPEEQEGTPEEEASESPAEEAKEQAHGEGDEEDLSEEDINSKLEHLMALKKKKQAKHS